MRQPHELLVDKFWLCHNSNLEVSAPMGSPSESRVCHRHEREAGWRAEDLIGGSRQHVLFHGEPTWIRKKNTHMQNIAEHSIAILQVRIAEAQG
jgi:hypothetical protein